jgi:hypothetical protein
MAKKITTSDGNQQGISDERASARWDKSDISYKNYISYIDRKDDKFKLTLIDHLYVSNFKGGNATVNEPEKDIEKKLKQYEQVLVKIEKQIKKSLSQLDDKEKEGLISIATEAFDLTTPASESKIDGFSISFVSALLHFYFPNLLPILDRRVLNGLDLLKKCDIDNQGQVKNIKRFYPELIKAFGLELKKNPNRFKTIREYDRELFQVPISLKSEE